MNPYPWPLFDQYQRIEEVKTFFASIAIEYDIFDKNSYWELSDGILWEILKKKVLDNILEKDNISILDAGVGTARWLIRMLDYLPNSIATTFDISPEMLLIAKKKLQEKKLDSRVNIYVDDIEELENLNDNKFDLVTCFYNVIGFNTNPILAINNLCNSVTQDGTLVLVLPNFYHAIYYSFQQNRMFEVERCFSTYSVKYTDKNPEVLLFTPRLIEEILHLNKFFSLEIMGFPVSLYPQFRGNEQLNLVESEFIHKAIDFETQLSMNTETAARGKNLLVIAKH